MARVPFKPTADLRQKVRHFAVLGLPQDDIATLIGCSAKTLRKHFRRELDQGGAEANAIVAGCLLQAAKNGNVAAQIFWLKTRARWSTTHTQPGDAEATTTESAESDARIIENMMARMRQASASDLAAPVDDPGPASDADDRQQTQSGDDNDKPE